MTGCYDITWIVSILMTLSFAYSAQAESRLELAKNWRIQNSEMSGVDGARLSKASYDDSSWSQATVPSTILSNLAGPHLGDGTNDDPFVGKNWLKLPGSGDYYPLGKNYGTIVTPLASPFGHPWWYRTSFKAQPGQFADLYLKGVTYGAEIWLNGVRLADSAATRGSYRQFKFDITSKLRAGTNTLAILVSPPVPSDLSASWVDWNPTPQDKNMGLWREVFISFHGPVGVRRSFVASSIHFPSADSADLTISSELTNSSAAAVSGNLIAETVGKAISQPVTLKPGEIRKVVFAPLRVLKPKLWWPWQMGDANMQTLKVRFEIAKTVSDRETVDYGIRKIDSTLTRDGSRLFSINEKPIFVRGGGWASDLLLRFSGDRQERELNYVRQLGLNTIRLEGRFETENLLSLADRKGILVMAGWVCCNAWQDSATYDIEHKIIARLSLNDQLYELRTHPGVIVFLYGSDEVPAQDVEESYLAGVKQTDWPNAILASASARVSLVGPTGVKMSGPYSYVPPSYWYADKSRFGGGWGFNTETSPGVSMPPMESLKHFIPLDHFGAIDDLWNFHMGENEFATLDQHREAIERRYGDIKDPSDFVKKSEVMDYDNHRAMFEAYSAHKYHSATGVVQWMLNSAWPSMMWHLYDFYLRPNSAFYGVKKANEPIHVSLSHDDLEVHVVNATYSDVGALTISAKMLDFEGHVFYSHEERLPSVAADSAVHVMTLPPLPAPPPSNARTNHGSAHLLLASLVSGFAPEPTPQPGTPSTPPGAPQQPAPGASPIPNPQPLPLPTPEPPPATEAEVYFVKLDVRDSKGALVDSNFYWLSTRKEVYDWEATDFKTTPVTDEGDLSPLEDLPPARVIVTSKKNGTTGMSVKITNAGKTLAFFVKLRLQSGREDVIPVDWNENNITLLPGESRTIKVRVPEPQNIKAPLVIHGEGWNVAPF